MKTLAEEEVTSVVGWAGETVLTTPRLLLRTFREDDLPLYAAMNADLEVMRHLGGVALSREDSDGIAEWAQGMHEREGIGLLAVERREDEAFLGMCGLHRVHWYPDDVEIAWRLAREHWGNGYATEAATAWLGYGFEVLALPRVISIADDDNVRSRAVMERIGMTFDHDAELDEEDQPDVTFHASIYAITKEAWHARAAG